MRQDLAIISQFENMISAINNCFSVIECMEISKKAEMLSACCKIAKDEDTFKKANKVRILAYKQIGKIFLDNWKPPLQYLTINMVSRARRRITLKVDKSISDTELMYSIMLNQIPEKDFDDALEIVSQKDHKIYSVVKISHPDIKKRYDERKAKDEKDKSIRFEYFKERIGVTLKRDFNESQKIFEFIIPIEMYEQMKRLACERSIAERTNVTMHEILRRGFYMLVDSYEFEKEGVE